MSREDRICLRNEREETWDGDGSTSGHLVYVFRNYNVQIWPDGRSLPTPLLKPVQGDREAPRSGK